MGSTNSKYKMANDAYGIWKWVYGEKTKGDLPVREKQGKVIVSRETANALDLAFLALGDARITKYKMIEACAKKLWGEDANVLNKISPEMMLEILIDGYESEPTPEERLENAIKKAYNSFALTCDSLEDFYSYRSGMRDALAAYGKSYDWLAISKDKEASSIKFDKSTKH